MGIQMKKFLFAIPMAAMMVATAASAQTLFSDGFESGNLSHTQNQIYWSAQGASTAVSSAKAKDGKYSLAFTFAAGSSSWSERRFQLTNQYTNLWFAYDLYVPSNYVHQNATRTNNKFLAIFRNPYNTPGFQMNFSLMANGSGGSNLTVHMYNNGSEIPYLTPAAGKNFITTSDLGKWHHIVAHVAVPTGPNTNDGVIQMWKDGKEVANYTNIGDYGGAGENYFDAGYVLGWANSGFAQTTVLYVDNFTISNTPLNVAAPAAPTSLNVTIK